MSTTIILADPPDYDLQALAEATRKSLAVLKPWTLLDTTNDPLAAQIVCQAGKYVSAIQLGVSAAYSGFTVTEEVLFLASALPIEDKEDLQDYLVGMMDLAREARENSNKAFEAFRNVRKEIFATTEILKAEKTRFQGRGNEGSTHTNRELPKNSADDIEALVKFAESISRFANWWDWVKVETDPSSATAQPMSCQLDALNDPTTVKRWNGLRSQYTAYVQMISELEDADPAFFKRASSIDIPRSPSTTPSALMESRHQPLTLTDRSVSSPFVSHSCPYTVPAPPNATSQSPPTPPFNSEIYSIQPQAKSNPDSATTKQGRVSLIQKFIEHMKRHKHIFKFVKKTLHGHSSNKDVVTEKVPNSPRAPNFFNNKRKSSTYQSESNTKSPNPL